MIKIRRKPGVRYTDDIFGGVCYVPHRDDFFALNHEAFAAFRQLPKQFREIDTEAFEALKDFVRLGIAEASGTSVIEEAYSGPSFLGVFQELPTVTQPLVINCFTTAWCPLQCKYCHADDLMTASLRQSERDSDIDNVLATARAVPAMVAVITGGDPLTRPERAERLIEGLASSKAIVLDTSGVGDIATLLPCLVKHKVHVRVSLDSALASENDVSRPINPKVVARGESCWKRASETIRKLIDANVPVSVQSVITSEYDREEHFFLLRDLLVEWGVRHWVLHVVVSGGKARGKEKLKPNRAVLNARLANFVKATMEKKVPIDIRCTDTDDRPNSVLLVASNGDLFTEGFAKKGKVKLFEARSGRPDKVQALMAHLDRFGHARRYLNWNPWFVSSKQSLEHVCRPFKQTQTGPASTAVETEFKLRILDPERVEAQLLKEGFSLIGEYFQRDEYYDTPEGFARYSDFVIRLRQEGSKALAAFKGPRFFSGDDASSRLEFEVPTTSIAVARAALTEKGLVRTWFLEKRRREYKNNKLSLKAFLDELPVIGFFLELEGSLDNNRLLLNGPLGKLGDIERKNYKDIAHSNALASEGRPRVTGLAFPRA